MMYEIEVQLLFDKLKTISKLYDHVRLVDPILKRVIQDGEISEFTVSCFEHFGKGKACTHCVSMRAYSKNQTFVKLERTAKEVFLVTAVPVNLEGRTVILELLKNITNNIIFQDIDGDNVDVSTSMSDNASLLASRDALTGIYNRRYIHDKLPMDLFSAALSKHFIAVIMVDIDYFKDVNDTYGHIAGDIVLKNLAEILQKGLMRESDWVARYGGEEFLVCLPGAKRDTALEIGERLRKSIEQHTIHFEDYEINITASFGICYLIPDNAITMEEFIDRADKKLYEAKNNGRNRVEI